MPLLVIVLLVSACAVIQTPQVVKVALVAPFEGRYREVGYEALYAARLALSDSIKARESVDLLAVDDGGTEAPSRAAALTEDPQVLAALVLGYDATTPEALRAFGDIPVVVIGEWGAEPITDSVLVYSNPEIARQITTLPRVGLIEAATLPAPLIGGDVFSLPSLSKLRDSLGGITILSSGTLPDADFTERYKGGDPFAPEPSLLATLTYSATSLTVFGWAAGSRESVRDWLAPAFTDGYANDAQIQRYHYVNGELVESDVTTP